jgi:cytochrome P450
MEANIKFEFDSFNKLDSAFLYNPYRFYQDLRDHDPVYWSEFFNSWVITRYDDIVVGLRDPRLSVNRCDIYMGMLPEDVQKELESLRRFYSLWLMFSDPPDHIRVRKLLNRYFTPRTVANAAQFIQHQSNELLDIMQSEKQADLLHSFAHPLSVFVIASVLGVPTEDYDLIKKWSNDIVSFLGTGLPVADKGRQAQNSLFKMTNYFEELVSNRQVHPKNDLISSLILDRDKDGCLSSQELIAICANLLVDGHEPVSNLIGNGMLALLQYPEQLDILKKTPYLIGNAVEELLRYDCPFQYCARRTKEEIMIRGQRIEKNQRLLFMIGSGNRDPKYFQNPDRLDIGHSKNSKHLAFGLGTHYCVGAALGRLTIGVAISTLLDRSSKLSLMNYPIEWHRSLGYRGLRSLHINLYDNT